MSLETAVAELTGTHAEVLAQVKARMTTGVGRLPGAELGGVLLGFGVGLISFITDKAAATGTSSLIRDICIGMTDRFKPDGEIDFSSPANVALIDAFLADAEVAALLATGSIPAQYVKDAILAKASVAEPEFPNVTLRDIVLIREPLLLVTHITAPQVLVFQPQTFGLVVHADLPCPINLRAEVCYNNDGIWHPVQSFGLDAIQLAGPYHFRVSLPASELEENTVYVRVVSDFEIDMSL
jgi:hypothetical protein